jgi:hypothetical protein
VGHLRDAAGGDRAAKAREASNLKVGGSIPPGRTSHNKRANSALTAFDAFPYNRGVARDGAPSRSRRVCSGLLLSLLSLLLTLGALEAAFRFIPRSGPGLAVKLWLERCWRLDATGYREQPASPGGASTIIVVGDSFAAGFGICDPRDRFADQLAARLHEARPGQFTVFAVAAAGLGTRSEWERLQRFPHRPHLLVLAYYANDIEDTAADFGLRQPHYTPYAGLPWPMRPLVERSYLLNFVYWSVPRGDLAAYREYYLGIWKDPRVVARHLGELDAFFPLGVPVVLVIFPHLTDLDVSAVYVDKVAGHFRARGAHVVDVRDLVRDLPVRERVVNAADFHASVAVHHRVGRALTTVVDHIARESMAAQRTDVGSGDRSR